MATEIITSIISSIIGGLLVAIVNHVFTRKKTEAETDKLRAETEKIRAEAEKIRTEIGGLRNTVEEASYLASATSDKNIYDSTSSGIEGYDVEGTDLVFRDGVLFFQRLFGRFSLQKYMYEGKERNFLPKNELIVGERKIKVSCEVKITQGECLFIIMFSPYPKGTALQIRNIEINNTDWKRVDTYFRIPSNIDCYLNIFLEPPSSEIAEKGSLQLRNLIVSERANE
jgi:hypothetical protein